MIFRKRFLTLLLTLLLTGAGAGRAQHNPAVEACGLPSLRAFIRHEVTYTLQSDCKQAGSLIVLASAGTITINGNGYRIKAGNGGFILLNGTRGSHIQLNDVILDGAGLARDWLVATTGTLEATGVTFTRVREGSALRAAGEARVTLSDVTFAANRGHGRGGSAMYLLENAGVALSDAIFRDNSGGAGAVVLRGESTLRAAGCLSFVENGPEEVVGNWLNDSRSSCIDVPVEHEPLRLGAIGIIYRRFEPELALDIYGIGEDSRGYFLLRVTQAQIDAAGSGALVSSTEDGRVAVHVEDDGHITVSMGPNDEGKVHHLTIKDNAGGSVIGTVDTIGGRPGAAGG